MRSRTDGWRFEKAIFFADGAGYRQDRATPTIC
jgi:hypothetical protein